MAVEFIEENLFDELTPQSVAREVGFSSYHFHRLFKALTGETIKQYIRKRRLTKAATRLRESRDPILQIALDSGFETQESFSRAFKKMLGESPAAYRHSRRQPPLLDRHHFTLELLDHLEGGITMKPRIVERGAELVVGMGGSYGEDAFEEISQLWVDFKKRKGEISKVIDGYALGVCLEKHPDLEINKGSTFIYMAGLPVSSVEKLPEGMVSCKIPPSRYAVFTHSGPLKDLPHTINYIWGTWVPNNSERHKKEAPDFELYDCRFDDKTASGDFDIFIPIKD